MKLHHFQTYHRNLKENTFTNAYSICSMQLVHSFDVNFVCVEGCHFRLNVNNFSFWNFYLIPFLHLPLLFKDFSLIGIIHIDMACFLIASEGEGLRLHFAMRAIIVLFLRFLQNFGLSLADLYKMVSYKSLVIKLRLNVRRKSIVFLIVCL